ncbi:hypothetical protein Dimus_031840 [Dionaea muscipula]
MVKELEVKKRRRLRKAASTEVVAAVDSEETQLDEDVLRLASDSDVNKEGQTKKRQLDQQVDELLARLFVSEAVDEGGSVKDEGGQRDGEEVLDVGVEEEEEKRDMGPSTSERRYRRRSLFSPKRLIVPSSHIVRSFMDVMMGCANRATFKSLHRLPLKYKCAILCRNMAETSLLTGEVLYVVIRTDDQRCRKIDRLMEEKYALEREVKELKFECDFAIEISTKMKTDIEMVMEDNQTLENKNEELKSALEGEKGKVQTLEDKVKEL